MIEGLTFDEAKHEYWANGRKVPGVTSILSMLDDFSGIPLAILEKKSQIGKATHTACEIINNGDEVDRESLHPAVAPYVTAYLKFLAENPIQVVLAERKVSNERHWFAGTLDLVFKALERKAGLWDRDQLCLPDLKTVASLRPSTGPQTAGYRLALPDLGEPRTRIQRLALQLKPDGNYHIEKYTNPDDEACFLSCLNIYNWRMKNV